MGVNSLVKEPICEIPQNAGSDARRVQKQHYNLTLDTVSTISAWFTVHTGVKIFYTCT